MLHAPRHSAVSIAVVLVTLGAAPAAWADKTDPAPADTGGVKGDAPPADGTDAKPADGAKPKAKAAPAEDNTMTDVTEKPGERYIFLGVRYRGDVIPQFLVNAFASQGGTFYSHIIGVEADIRKDGFSIIPALTYESYGTGGPVLFLQKGKDATNQGNWSVIDSSLGAVFATVDIQWSVKVHPNVDFEYGAGFGIGVVTGSLNNNWVYANPNGNLQDKGGLGGFTNFSQCTTTMDGIAQNSGASGCIPGNHTDSTPNKVGPGKGYAEGSLFSGGARPPIMPWLAIPQLGLRFKPIKQMQARVQIGLALTGFWFGLSADYGLEKTEKK